MLVQHYAIIPGRLLAGEYPGNRDSAIARQRVNSLIDAGVRSFIDLTHPIDGLQPYQPLFENMGKEFHYVRLSIPDMSVPQSDDVMHGILARIRSELAAGRTVYFHCWGGIGRTGTVAGCWLREQGLDGRAALTKVQSLYATLPKAKGKHPYSPQTPAQCAFVEDW